MEMTEKFDVGYSSSGSGKLRPMPINLRVDIWIGSNNTKVGPSTSLAMRLWA